MVQLKADDHFFYRNDEYIDDMEFVLLEDSDGGYLSIVADLLPNKMAFDTGGNNRWESSTLNMYLNTIFIQKISKYDNNRILLPIDSSCADRIWLLSKEEVETYQNILPKYHKCWWTRSPFVFGARSAWVVTPSGQLGSIYAVCAYWVAPVVRFSKSVVKVQNEDGNKIMYYK